jgi:hypothetical protein
MSELISGFVTGGISGFIAGGIIELRRKEKDRKKTT